MLWDSSSLHPRIYQTKPCWDGQTFKEFQVLFNHLSDQSVSDRLESFAISGNQNLFNPGPAEPG